MKRVNSVLLALCDTQCTAGITSSSVLPTTLKLLKLLKRCTKTMWPGYAVGDQQVEINALPAKVVQVKYNLDVPISRCMSPWISHGGSMDNAFSLFVGIVGHM